MATHKSAKKRARQALRRRSRNREYLARVRSAIKSFNTAMTSGEGKDKLAELLQSTQSLLGKAAKKGLIHRNNAARRVSNLAHSLAKYSTPAESKSATTASKAKKSTKAPAKKATAKAKKTPAAKKTAAKSKAKK